MTASASTAGAPPSQTDRSRLTTNPYVEIVGVFLGAGIAMLNSRLISVGLPDAYALAAAAFFWLIGWLNQRGARRLELQIAELDRELPSM